MKRPIVDLGFNTPNTQPGSAWDRPWVSVQWMRHRKEGPRNKKSSRKLSEQEAKQRASDMAQWVISLATKFRNLTSHVHTQEPQKRRLQMLKQSY